MEIGDECMCVATEPSSFTIYFTIYYYHLLFIITIYYYYILLLLLYTITIYYYSLLLKIIEDLVKCFIWDTNLATNISKIQKLFPKLIHRYENQRRHLMHNEIPLNACKTSHNRILRFLM